MNTEQRISTSNNRYSLKYYFLNRMVRKLIINVAWSCLLMNDQYVIQIEYMYVRVNI